MSRPIRYTVAIDARGNVVAFRRDDVIDPFFAGWLSLAAVDDVASLAVDLRDACHALNSDALAARLPWGLRDRLAS